MGGLLKFTLEQIANIVNSCTTAAEKVSAIQELLILGFISTEDISYILSCSESLEEPFQDEADDNWTEY